MPARPDRRSDRAVSEATSVAILVGFTVLVTASVGVSVLVAGSSDDPGTSANFTFTYEPDQSVLVVHERGDAIPAGQLVFEGETARATWAAVANASAETAVDSGSLVQLFEGNAWGAPVRRGDTIRVYYAPAEGNRTLLDEWTATP